MTFYWINRLNMVEFDGPFDTQDAAKSGAISAMNLVQGGMALDIAIAKVVTAGRIDGGAWVEAKDVGYEQRTPEQEAALQELVDQAQELNMGYDQNAAIDKAVDETLEQYPKTMAYLANEQSPPKSWLEAKKEIDEGWER